MTQSTKYRILLSISEMEFILSKITHDSPIGLREKLDLAIRKHAAGITRATHIPIGRQSIESQLGFETDNRASTIYQSWRAGVALSKDLLDKALEYGYLNDLLSEGEKIDYESKLISSSPST